MVCIQFYGSLVVCIFKAPLPRTLRKSSDGGGGFVLVTHNMEVTCLGLTYNRGVTFTPVRMLIAPTQTCT